MYSTSSENTRVVWAAHGYNVVFSDEIGHWEYCNAVNFSAFPFPCTSAGAGESGLDDDDVICAPASASLLVQVSGCTQSDEDFDGVSYQKVWPGIAGNAASSTPGPVIFSRPTFNRSEQYSPSRSRPTCRESRRQVCLPTTTANASARRARAASTSNGAEFYPLFVVRTTGQGCLWYEAGSAFPGQTQTFGGSSTTEFGPLLRLDYPSPTGNLPRFNDFRNVVPNSCPSP
jgi:hypothetical protein